TGSDLRLGLRFVISDPQEESYAFTFTLTIPGGEPIPVNATLTLKLPVVTPGGLTVTQGKSASSLVTFQNATSLEVVTRPTNGALSLANDGTFSYAPNGQYFGADSFTYRGRNLDGVSKPETVSISVVRQFEGNWSISVRDFPNDPCVDAKNLETSAGISKASDTLYLTSYQGSPIELRMSSADDPAGLTGSATVTYPEDNGTTVQSLNISVPNSTTLSGGGSWTWTRPATDTMPAMTCTGSTVITGSKP
ncbi:MAG: Ig-like domain-containing protein, partial [Gammaproteobacteria bacterium]